MNEEYPTMEIRDKLRSWRIDDLIDLMYAKDKRQTRRFK